MSFNDFPSTAANAPAAQPAIDESLANSHRTMSRIEYVLEGLLADLNGSDTAPGGAGEYPSCGLVADADRLACRIDNLSALVDRVKVRLVSSKVAQGVSGAIGQRPL